MFDVVIVGGGLAGSALACALADAPLALGMLESRLPAPDDGSWDSRIYAISPANAGFLERIGGWPGTDCERIAPVHRMEIFGDRGGRLTFSAFDSGVGELAWIVEGGLIQRLLWAHMRRQANLRIFCPATPERLIVEPQRARLTVAGGEVLETRLVAAADGVDSWVRRQAGIEVLEQSYGELGVVANLRCERAHENTAYQWFRADGVLAFLPLPGAMTSIVWSTAEEHGRELLSLAPEEFCDRVREAAGARLGALELVTGPRAFPLRLMRARRTVAERVALVGDAGHAIHPLSGHGINLGFQDAHELARAVAEAGPPRDPGALPVLRRYERARAEEVLALQSVTHVLQRLFGLRSAPAALARNAGLNLTNSIPVVRNLLARYAMG
jgi:ubiquinone biosynthesis UbiH/UbiF/VisC/COQ6 family hydroxylase